MKNFDAQMLYSFVVQRADGSFYDSYVLNRRVDAHRSNVELGTSKYGTDVVRFVNSLCWYEEDDNEKSERSGILA